MNASYKHEHKLGGCCAISKLGTRSNWQQLTVHPSIDHRGWARSLSVHVVNQVIQTVSLLFTTVVSHKNHLTSCLSYPQYCIRAVTSSDCAPLRGHTVGVFAFVIKRTKDRQYSQPVNSAQTKQCLHKYQEPHR